MKIELYGVPGQGQIRDPVVRVVESCARLMVLAADAERRWRQTGALDVVMMNPNEIRLYATFFAGVRGGS